MLAALDGALTSGLPRELCRLEAGLAAQPFDRDGVARARCRRWIDPNGRELIEIVPAENVNDNAAARRFIAAVRAVVPNATGLPVVYEEASQRSCIRSQLALVYSFIMVTMIIWILLRDVTGRAARDRADRDRVRGDGRLTALIDMPLNFANIIALPLLVGIGVDNGIHVVHRMRTEPTVMLAFETSTLRRRARERSHYGRELRQSRVLLARRDVRAWASCSRSAWCEHAAHADVLPAWLLRAA